MKAFIYILLIFSFQLPENITQTNSIKEEAEVFISTKDYKNAYEQYKYLVVNHQSKEASVLYNYATLCLIMKDSLTALSTFYKIQKTTKNPQILSKAMAQAGSLEYLFNKNSSQAITLLETSLLLDGTNEQARINLYVIFSTLEKTIDDSNKTHRNIIKLASQSETQITQSDSNNINVEQKEDPSNDIRDHSISKDQARRILDALQKNEIQFLQQLNLARQDTSSTNDNYRLW